MTFDPQLRSKRQKATLVHGLKPPVENFQLSPFFVDILVDHYEILTSGVQIFKTAQIL